MGGWNASEDLAARTRSDTALEHYQTKVICREHHDIESQRTPKSARMSRGPHRYVRETFRTRRAAQKVLRRLNEYSIVHPAQIAASKETRASQFTFRQNKRRDTKPCALRRFNSNGFASEGTTGDKTKRRSCGERSGYHPYTVDELRERAPSISDRLGNCGTRVDPAEVPVATSDGTALLLDYRFGHKLLSQANGNSRVLVIGNRPLRAADKLSLLQAGAAGISHCRASCTCSSRRSTPSATETAGSNARF